MAEGPGLRQSARILGTSHTTVSRLVERAGRHCSLFHRRLLRGALFLEPLVIDGFESFEFSQFFPFHANLAAGARSWFIYHFTDSPLRRKGAMSAAQRQRRAQLEHDLGRPDPKTVEQGIFALLRPLLTHVPAPRLRLYSDDHPAYRRALRHLRREAPQGLRIDHHVTPSTQRRTQSNPLFPVNLADLLLRHGCANHRRETIAFSKRRQAALERLAIFTVWRNCIKRRRERQPRSGPTAAMVAGLDHHPWTWRRVLGRRLFPAHAELPPEWEAYYWRQVKTLALGARQTVHARKYAF
jgi:hypothetical protein